MTTPEQEPEIYRVTFDVVAADLSATLAAVGGLAIHDSLRYHPEPTTEAECPFNPRYSILVHDEAAGETLPIITKTHLQDFCVDYRKAAKDGAARRTGTKVYMALTALSSEPAVKDCFYTPAGGRFVEGIRADKAALLAVRLENKIIRIGGSGLGVKGIALFREFCTHLTRSERR